jgi:CBS-domain-containing membrane protein
MSPGRLARRQAAYSLKDQGPVGDQMDKDEQSVKPLRSPAWPVRRQLHLKGELVLAVLPTITVLGMLYLVKELSHQTILFASLASSAFLIYLDPEHSTNSIRTLVASQLTAALVGLLLYLVLGAGFVSAGTAMVITILAMILLDAVHPPAVATSVMFALRAGDAGNVLLFGLALAIVAVLVLLERAMVWLLAWTNRQ